jgi:hypothetical protein
MRRQDWLCSGCADDPPRRPRRRRCAARDRGRRLPEVRPSNRLEPGPITADYPQAVRNRQAWAAVEDGEIAGFAILIARPGYTHRAEQDGFGRVFLRKPID